MCNVVYKILLDSLSYMCTPYPQEKKGLTQICTSSVSTPGIPSTKKPFFSLSRVIDHSNLSFSEANAHCFYAYIHAHVHNYVDQMHILNSVGKMMALALSLHATRHVSDQYSNKIYLVLLICTLRWHA